MEPVFEQIFVAAELMKTHPPRFQDRNKQIVFQVACPSGVSHSGSVTFARYRSASLPVAMSAKSDTVLEQREDIFKYESASATPGAVEWYLNFANTDLFCAYGARAFAQDELQVMEHPALGALREALAATSRGHLFTVEHREPTPIVIMGVERRCEIATAPNAVAGQPNGLYGRLFSIADPEVVRRATRPIIPPTVSNILAIEAPANGEGRYTPAQIELILSTAYSGFSAAQTESNRRVERGRNAVVVHTGYWGCGVYGNDRVLMVLLQLLAAKLSRLDRLVFHTVDAAEAAAYQRALSILETELFSSGFLRRLFRISPNERDLADVLGHINSIGFRWGKGDGN